MANTLKVGSTILPEPTKVKEGYQLIWSSDTGRNASDAEMIGKVVAEKLTLDINWKNISETELNTIKTAMPRNFFTLTYAGSNITGYRGDIQADVIDINNGVKTYGEVSVQFIEK